MTATQTVWKSARLRPELYREIEYAVDHIEHRGVAKYNSISDFCTKACILLLDKEGVHYNE